MGKTILYWPIWDPDEVKLFMLSHSIGTFRAHFGEEARYVVLTDQPDQVTEGLLTNAEVFSYKEWPTVNFADKACNWRKWAPSVRIDSEAVEVRIDVDIFVVNRPTEIIDFCRGLAPFDYLVTQEWFTALWPYGNFGSRLPANFTPINSGLLGQARHASLASEMLGAYNWWKRSVHNHEIKFHDEQGALALILQEYIKAGKVQVLCPLQYRVVGPLDITPVESLEGIKLLHATSGGHPAFWKFVGEISAVSGLPDLMPGASQSCALEEEAESTRSGRLLAPSATKDISPVSRLRNGPGISSRRVASCIMPG